MVNIIHSDIICSYCTAYDTCNSSPTIMGRNYCCFTGRKLQEMKEDNKCPDCNIKLEMFTSDLDWCPKCKKEFSGK